MFLYRFGTYWATISTTIVYKYEDNTIKNIIANFHRFTCVAKEKEPNV
jgi:ppGpp synthetase/RelA/SpoT-type nucleotidyltranferase